MTDTRWADVRTENGHQIIVLPADIHLDGDRVAIHQDDHSGNITLRPSTQAGTLKDLLGRLDAIKVPEEDLDAFMVERPMNTPVSFRNPFDEE
jgi:virulence-associated protein VagC